MKHTPAGLVRLLIAVPLLLVFGEALCAQSSDINLNEYYRFPVSLSASYQPLAGTGSKALADFTIQEIAGELRFTLPAAPVLQPFIRLGVMDYAFVGDAEETNQDWSHRHLFTGPGFGYSSRLNGDFEMGAEVFAALSQSFFDKLEGPGINDTMGQLNVIGGASARLALNPSYGVSVSVVPSVRYTLGLGPLDSFDGLTFGVGFGVSYRFGEDPDSAQAVIRSLQFSGTVLPPAFAAMQSYYTKEPVGVVTITNGEKYPLRNLEISFMQAGFMDSPTPVFSLPELAPGASADVPVLAGFNNQVFLTQGVTPLNGELIANYSVGSRHVEQRQSVTYELHDKNALTWDDDRKAAAFITPQDSAIKNYASFIRQSAKDDINPYLSSNLQFAMQLYSALANLGIIYQVDPVQPFTSMQEEVMVVDSISLPRETLVRKTGDCDDLTVLFASILQTVGIESALVTTPGHIYCAFDTGVAAADYSTVHPVREMSIVLDGTLWVPVEITLIGRGSFMEAWETGSREYRNYETAVEKRGFYPVAAARNIYRPVVLRETDLGLQYGAGDPVRQAFNEEMKRLAEQILKPYREKAERAGNPKAWNSFGVMAAKLGFISQARDGFNKALRLDRNFVGSKINLGSLAYLEKDYAEAVRAFEDARSLLESRQAAQSLRTSVTLNLSKAYYALEIYEKAEALYREAYALDPEASNKMSYLASSGNPAPSGESYGSLDAGTPKAGNRAAEATGDTPILFVDQELP